MTLIKFMLSAWGVCGKFNCGCNGERESTASRLWDVAGCSRRLGKLLLFPNYGSWPSLGTSAREGSGLVAAECRSLQLRGVALTGTTRDIQLCLNMSRGNWCKER